VLRLLGRPQALSTFVHLRVGYVCCVAAAIGDIGVVICPRCCEFVPTCISAALFIDGFAFADGAARDVVGLALDCYTNGSCWRRERLGG